MNVCMCAKTHFTIVSRISPHSRILSAFDIIYKNKETRFTIASVVLRFPSCVSPAESPPDQQSVSNRKESTHTQDPRRNQTRCGTHLTSFVPDAGGSRPHASRGEREQDEGEDCERHQIYSDLQSRECGMVCTSAPGTPSPSFSPSLSCSIISFPFCCQSAIPAAAVVVSVNRESRREEKGGGRDECVNTTFSFAGDPVSLQSVERTLNLPLSQQ